VDGNSELHTYIWEVPDMIIHTDDDDKYTGGGMESEIADPANAPIAEG
jgi:hypothetical protein